ncbi:MAG: transcription-repair coupling factor, partial [Luminiphilus sp.]|nr:transcription-repair coupling factor [Luminiphilus sp.]
RALKRGEIPDVDGPLESSTEVKLHIPALIPDDYLPDITSRLVLYKRIAASMTQEGLREIQVEMIDRFGLLPDATKNLFTQASIKVRAQRLGIAEIEVGDRGGSIAFTDQTQVEPMTLVRLVQDDPKTYGLAGSNKLRFSGELPALPERQNFIDVLLEKLEQETA